MANIAEGCFDIDSDSAELLADLEQKVLDMADRIGSLVLPWGLIPTISMVNSASPSRNAPGQSPVTKGSLFHHFSPSLSFSFDSEESVEANSADGTEITPMPNKTTNDVKMRPPTVMGY